MQDVHIVHPESTDDGILLRLFLQIEGRAVRKLLVRIRPGDIVLLDYDHLAALIIYGHRTICFVCFEILVSISDHSVTTQLEALRDFLTIFLVGVDRDCKLSQKTVDGALAAFEVDRRVQQRIVSIADFDCVPLLHRAAVVNVS